MVQNSFNLFLFLFLILAKQAIAQPSHSLFKKVEPSYSNIDFVNTPLKKKGFNILEYFYYYNGGGVAIGDINNDDLQDIYFSANSTNGNRLYLNKGNFIFEDITTKAGADGTADWSTGVTMADVNGDGFLDIYISVVTDSFGLQGANQLLINNGDTTFTDMAAEYGLNIEGFTSQVAFFDYDRDNDLDCFILSQSIAATDIFQNASDRKIKSPKHISRMFRNELNKGLNKFTDVSTETGIYQSDIGFGLGITVADINNDGWDDIYITNDFYEDDYYYVNKGDGTFSEEGKQTFNHFSMNSMGLDIADCNNDGELDIITADMLPDDEINLKTEDIIRGYYLYDQTNLKKGYHPAYVKNSLQINNGNASSFSETGLLSGIAATDWSWAPLFSDFDNDGKKDLIITSGIPKLLIDLDIIRYYNTTLDIDYNKEPNKFNEAIINKMKDANSHPYLYKGDGNAAFTDVSKAWGTLLFNNTSTNGAAYGDLDNDGDLDLVMNNNGDTAIVLKNAQSGNNFIGFSFRTGNWNTAGIGTKVYIYTDSTIQYQQLMLTRGFQSSVAPQLHFGLGKYKKVDSVKIVWPNQQIYTLQNIAINKYHVLSPADKPSSTYIKKLQPKDNFTDISSKINIEWQHLENRIADYRYQRLIPQAKSTKGPKITIGDINKDGLEDFFACGAAGQAGTLYLQNKDGGFDPSNSELFEIDKTKEDVDALFFDADNDGDLDLFVVSGGNMYETGSPNLFNRLYINDGLGKLTKSNEQIPAISEDESSVTVLDIDNDGDLDLFLGNYIDAKSYGKPQTSYVLLNKGNGYFSIVERFFQRLGMVTDIAIADVNNDNRKDIIVVGEWMPITLFIVDSLGVTKKELPNSTGLWQSVFVDDINNDGNIDFFAGNWGYNSIFSLNKTPPLRLYVGDFNKNGSTEQLLTYIRKGTEYSFLGKQSLEMSLPILKKNYLLHREFAGVPFHDIFGEMVKNTTPLIAEQLGSKVCFGDGNGSFKMMDLPTSLQKAPINKITTGNLPNEYIFGGNMFGLTPQEGRYDAQPLAIAVFKNNTFECKKHPNLSAIKGEIKDLQWIKHVKHGKILIVARNNKALTFLKPNN